MDAFDVCLYGGALAAGAVAWDGCYAQFEQLDFGVFEGRGGFESC
jgi:hypothetical protein